MALLCLCLPVAGLSAFIKIRRRGRANPSRRGVVRQPQRLAIQTSDAVVFLLNVGWNVRRRDLTNLIVAARYEDEFPTEDRIGLFGLHCAYSLVT